MATRQLAYTTLFPVRYHLYRLQAGAAAGSVNPQDVTSYSCATSTVTPTQHRGLDLHRAEDVASVRLDGAVGSVGVTASGNGGVEQWAYATADDRFAQDKDHAAQLPSAKLLGLMFETPTDDAYQTAPLFDPLSFALDAYGNATANTETVTHVDDSVHKFGGGPCRPTSSARRAEGPWLGVALVARRGPGVVGRPGRDADHEHSGGSRHPRQVGSTSSGRGIPLHRRFSPECWSCSEPS